MTVRELRIALEGFPDDMDVVTAHDDHDYNWYEEPNVVVRELWFSQKPYASYWAMYESRSREGVAREALVI